MKPVFLSPLTSEQLKAKDYFMGRMRKRKERHGDFRQVFVDCGGMCVRCHSVYGLEFHEPFGEDHKEEGRMQSRLLFCTKCHQNEHPGHAKGQLRLWEFKTSILAEDMDLEIFLHGGWDEWIKDFGLIDRFGINLIGDVYYGEEFSWLLRLRSMGKE